MAAIAAGFIVAGVVTLLALLVQMSAEFRGPWVWTHAIEVGCTVGLAAGGAVWWWG